MDSQQYPQSILPDADRGRLQRLFHKNLDQSDEAEGGLNLGQVLGTLRRRVLVIAGVTTVVTSAAVLKAMTSTPIYQSSFEILTKPVTVETRVISSLPQTLAGKDQQSSESQDKGIVDETKLKLLKSPRLLAPVVKQLKSKYPEITYDLLLSSLTVTASAKSETLEVGYQDANAEKVKAVLALISKSYLDYSLQERLADVSKGIEFVENQLPQLQNRVQTVQEKLQWFRQQYNLVDPESQGKQLSEQMGTFEQQRLETQVQLGEAIALYKDLQTQLAKPGASDAAAIATLSENPRYQKLLGELLQVDAQIAKDSSLYLEDSPDIQVLRTQRQNLLPLLGREGKRVQSEVASKIRALEARNQALDSTKNFLNQQVKQLSAISRQYVDIQRELQIATDNLNQFLTKREALRIDAGQRETPWQILTPPGEPTLTAANAKRTAMLGVILGLLLGVGVALLLDKVRDVLHTTADVKEAGKLPVLGVIPYNPEIQQIEHSSLVTDLADLVQQMRTKLPLSHRSKADYLSASPFLEAFRSLYTNIRLLNSDTQIRSLTITSSTPGDGKSTTALYIAQAAAALGQRVLLVDTDLRRPQLHNRLNLANDCGLSNVIASDLNVERVVQRSPLEPNLHILTAGLTPPDPTRLLSSQKMQHLMEQFQATYDLVIYDNPPILGLADAKLIAPRTDGIILVVGLGSTRKSALSQAIDALKLPSVALLGIVANSSKEHSSDLYTTYHYYSQSSDPLLGENGAFAVKQSGDYDN